MSEYHEHVPYAVLLDAERRCVEEGERRATAEARVRELEEAVRVREQTLNDVVGFVRTGGPLYNKDRLELLRMIAEVPALVPVQEETAE